MGQKIHPVGFRIGITKQHQSRWFSESFLYSGMIVEDLFLRNFILKELSHLTISNIEIERKFKDQIQVTLYSPKPELMFINYDNNLEFFTDVLKKQLIKYRKERFLNLYQQSKNKSSLQLNDPVILIKIFEIISPDKHASLIASFIVDQLQKRVAFRRAMKKAISKAKKAKVTGIKIQIAGRLNGAEIARSEWIRDGRVPLQSLRANIDYYSKKARTIYGILGVKVWVFQE